MRNVRPRRGQRNFCGDWWMATGHRHVAFESWVERDFLISADFAPEIVAVSSQPFTFDRSSKTAPRRSHTPDFFLRLADGSACVVDVRPEALVKPPDQEQFDATEQLCDELGWSYRRVGEQPAVLSANLRWLTGYRFPRACDRGTAEIVEAQMLRSGSLTLRELARAVGDPVVALPTIYHLIWNQTLRLDLRSRLLHEHAEVTVSSA